MFKKLQAFWQLMRNKEFYGNTLAVTIIGSLFNPATFDLFMLVRFFLIGHLLTAFAFTINDIEDAEDDAKDPAKVKRNPISAKRLKKGEAWVFTWGLAAVTMLLAWPLGRAVTTISFIGLFLGFLYSYKGVRLKSMPVVDLLSHGLFLGTAQFLLPALAFDSPLTPMIILAASGVFGVSFLGDLRNEIRDYKVDRETGIRNTASIIDVRAINSIHEHLYAIPVFVVAFAVVQTLTPEKRLPLLIGMAALMIVWVLLPAALRKKLAQDSNQIVVTIGGIAAYIFSQIQQ